MGEQESRRRGVIGVASEKWASRNSDAGGISGWRRKTKQEEIPTPGNFSCLAVQIRGGVGKVGEQEFRRRGEYRGGVGKRSRRKSRRHGIHLVRFTDSGWRRKSGRVGIPTPRSLESRHAQSASLLANEPLPLHQAPGLRMLCILSRWAVRDASRRKASPCGASCPPRKEAETVSSEQVP